MRRFTNPVRTSALALVVSATFVLALTPARAFAVDPGQPVPSFSARSLDGDTTLALSAYRGKVVYLDFWASWCGPCQTAMPMIEQLSKEFPADQFQVIAVNLDEKPEKAKQFLEAHKISYPTVSDPQGNLPKSFGLKTMPTSYLIDRAGVVRYVHPGFRASDIDELRKKIREVLNQGSLPASPEAKR
ncbi:MAG TPA: TlpA disulfide reductase family protein [Myxococcota bacterium]|nr:TlpA disulfide reductase family protein [Myxococcota bacterium]